MKILITGGAGFIGVNLIGHLIELYKNKVKIYVIDNETVGKKSDINYKIEKFYKLDITKDTTYKKINKNYDVIIHLAGQTSVVDSNLNPDLAIQNNIIGTFKLFEFARKNKINKIVAASTGGAIAGDYNKVINELTLPKPISPYGITKLFIESLAFSYNVSFKMKISCLRFSNVYGPYCHRKESVISIFLKNIIKNKTLIVYGDGNQKRDYIHVNDITLGIYRAIINKKFGIYQFSTGKSTSINKLIKIIKEDVGKNHKLKIRYKNKRVGEVYQTRISNKKAQKDINFKVNKDLKEGIKDTWKWLVKNQHYI